MPSRRMIDPAFWRSQNISQLTEPQRLLFIGIISNADDQGRMEAHPALIRSDVYPYDDKPLKEIKADLEAIAQVGSVYLYEAGGKALLQIPGWWDYQSPQWAYPSKLLPPPGWRDRLRYRANNEVKTDNWGDKAIPNSLGKEMPKGDGQGDGRPHSISTSVSVMNSDSEDSADADAPPPPDDIPDPSELTVKEIQALELSVEQWRIFQERERNGRNRSTALRFMRSQLNPIAPAVQVYRSLAETTPVNVICAKIAESVGTNEDDLEFWREVVIGYIAQGWNKYNVSNMLDFYKRRETPSNGRSASGQRPTKGLDASKRAITEWAASHGTDLGVPDGDT